MVITKVTIFMLFPNAKELSYYFSNCLPKMIKTSKLEEKISFNEFLAGFELNENNKIFALFFLKWKIRELIYYFKKKIKTNIYFDIRFIEDQFKDANLIASYIAKLLKNRTPYRRVIKETIQKIKSTNLKGIKIQIAGRLDGAEKARTEWELYGKIPLQTLTAKIDYSSQFAQTFYGVLGIKVWIFE